jgi:predicted ABC-type transport system involved in lysophospholipase L1 biosynthesis ATPase subunit
MSEAPILSASGVRMHFLLGRRRIEVLRGVDVRVDEGESLCIRGASGAGKSTLLHILGGLERPSAGAVTFRGEDLYRLSETRRAGLRARTLGFVFQAYHLLPELDVLENVALPARGRGGMNAAAGKAALNRARDLLDQVGLSHRLGHRPMELSGGEQQRVALARALINDPAVLLADEPTGNLDSQTGAEVLDHLFALTGAARRTLVLVTHNEAVAERCGRSLALVDGVVA